MFDKKIIENLYGIVGLEQDFNPTYAIVDANNLQSRSGYRANGGGNPFVKIQYIKECQDYAQITDLEFNELLARVQKSAIVEVCSGQTLKVIIETALLSKNEIIQATNICERAGANFVKTSTGFSTRGASLLDIEHIKTARTTDIKIKASGGIKDLKTALEFINLGADRIGASKGVEIIESLK